VSKGRIEAFSDGVIAIIITIMVLELRPPEGAALSDLAALAPVSFTYALSFVLMGIYWVNHHHLFQAAKTVDGRVLWANLHLLFWLSLFPFGTGWMGAHPGETVPVAAYGAVLTMAAIAYTILLQALIAAPGQTPALAAAVAGDVKGKLSLGLYIVAVLAALVAPLVSVVVYVVVAALWFIPDRRMERVVRS
jgi:uncharacterized membrane protein